jgi:hypothetical protein
MRTSMQPDYGITSPQSFQRSTFNLSHSHKTTCNASNLVPIYWDWLLPGEVRKGGLEGYVRMSNPLDFPMMDNVYLTAHWFAVQIRNIWDNGRKFFGERENPGDSISYTLPVLGSGNVDLTLTTTTAYELADFLGLPHVSSFDQADATSLPFRAYNSIFNWHYRDSSIDDEVYTQTDDGPETSWTTNYVLQNRRKRFDYFTNQLPAPQRGESQTIGGEIAADLTAGANPTIENSGGNFVHLDANAALLDLSSTAGTQAEALYPNTTINELRNAVAIQRLLEADNRYGQRYPDVLYSQYGAVFNDNKHAPVYLGGGRAPLNITPITSQAGALSTATPESTDTYVGDLNAIGSGNFSGANFSFYADEPMLIMCIISFDADLTYHQGLDRKWSYRTRYDFPLPYLQGIGDQATLNKELYYQNTSADDDVFGYAPRYEEARIGINRLSREMRPDNATPLDTWHVAQDFVGLPTLNTTFLTASVPMGRVMKSSTPDHFICDFYIRQHATKPLSRRGVPGLARL